MLLLFCSRTSNRQSLEAAIKSASAFLKKAVKPVLVGGPNLRVAKAQNAFVRLADASEFATALMPSAKGLFPETHPHFLGTYWGPVSSPFCMEIVESADAYLFAGPLFTDYSSVGYSLLIKKEKMIRVDVDRVTVGGEETYGCVLMADFLQGLAAAVTPNKTAVENYERIFVPMGVPPKSEKDAPLRTNILFQHIQVGRNFLGF